MEIFASILHQLKRKCHQQKDKQNQINVIKFQLLVISARNGSSYYDLSNKFAFENIPQMFQYKFEGETQYSQIPPVNEIEWNCYVHKMLRDQIYILFIYHSAHLYLNLTLLEQLLNELEIRNSDILISPIWHTLKFFPIAHCHYSPIIGLTFLSVASLTYNCTSGKMVVGNGRLSLDCFIPRVNPNVTPVKLLQTSSRRTLSINAPRGVLGEHIKTRLMCHQVSNFQVWESRTICCQNFVMLASGMIPFFLISIPCQMTQV